LQEGVLSFLNEISFNFSLFASVGLRRVDVSLSQGLLKGLIIAVLPAFLHVEILGQFLIQLLFI
jgi:hypothetical protein